MGTKYEFGPDLRPAEQVLSDLIKVTTSPKGKIIRSAAYDDLTDFSSML